MARTLFITGTGTDIGKTALSLAILLWARERGLRAAYCKPVQCGSFAFGSPPREGGDAEWIRTLAGEVPTGIPVHVTYRLRMPASPHLAAEREGLALDPARIGLDLDSLRAGNDLLIVEGAGGAAVPLDRRGTSLAALAAARSIPCLIACAPGLGTLHHTLATVAYLKTLAAPMAGFAFCRREKGEESEAVPELAEDNQATLAALTGLPFFGSLPHSETVARGVCLTAAEASAWCAPLAPSLEAWWNRARA